MNTDYMPETVPVGADTKSYEIRAPAQGTYTSWEVTSYEINGGNIIRITTNITAQKPQLTQQSSTSYSITDVADLAENDLLSDLLGLLW